MKREPQARVRSGGRAALQHAEVGSEVSLLSISFCFVSGHDLSRADEWVISVLWSRLKSAIQSVSKLVRAAG